MKSNEAMETLYNLINDLSGPIQAKNAVSDALFNIISELHEEGLPVTGEALEERLTNYANDYLYAFKNKSDVA